MAETAGQLTENTNNPSTPLPSIPIHLSGFLTGDAIHVQGDTHKLQFSVLFNFHHKYNSDPRENQTPLTSTSSSYVTPTTTHQDGENHNNPLCDTIDWTPETPQDLSVTNEDENRRNLLCDTIDWTPTTPQNRNVKDADAAIVTRLKSGVLSPVKYYTRSTTGTVSQNVDSRKNGLKKRGRGELMDVLERVLKRHSLPTRPCNSYSFFVMASWDVVKSSSFGDTSTRLGEMWSKLSMSDKKVFEDMALKDRKRYMKQCMMLRSKKKQN